MDLKLAAELAVHLFFPESCPLCGATGVPVCPQCLDRALAVPRPMPQCLECGAGTPCPDHGTRFQLRALTLHRGAARDLLLAAKYGGSGRLAMTLGERLAALVPDLGGDWTVVPIPPHGTAQFVPRGDGHLDWMARGLSRIAGLRVRHCLKWTRKRTPQKQQPCAQARRAMPRDVFTCESAPEKAVVLDDVSTTGTTLLRASSALYARGAREVLCLCWSVTPR